MCGKDVWDSRSELSGWSLAPIHFPETVDWKERSEMRQNRLWIVAEEENKCAVKLPEQ
jgi:hypothetical protein